MHDYQNRHIEQTLEENNIEFSSTIILVLLRINNGLINVRNHVHKVIYDRRMLN